MYNLKSKEVKQDELNVKDEQDSLLLVRLSNSQTGWQGVVALVNLDAGDNGSKGFARIGDINPFTSCFKMNIGIDKLGDDVPDNFATVVLVFDIGMPPLLWREQSCCFSMPDPILELVPESDQVLWVG